MSIVIRTPETVDRPKSEQRRSGWQLSIKRGLLALAVLLLALLTLGFGYETIAAAVDAWRFPPPGKLITVGGEHEIGLI